MSQHLSDEEKTRREKLTTLRQKKLNPYRNGLTPSHTTKQVRDAWGEKTREELEGEGIRVSVAGRIMAFRHFGKASFITVKDRSGKLQVYVAQDAVGEDSFATFRIFDVGDIVYAEGKLFRTKTNELSLHATKIDLLTKSLRPLPEKFHGLQDVEQKYRMRYVDLIMNDDSRRVFELRSKTTRYIRDFFAERDFLEVETPMMHPIAGGAAARPFKTHHNTLDMDLFLRIAPELYLKRLVVGGMERVFEINRNFRNEGVSVRHNPEFTMLEFYWAYATYHELMNLTEELFSGLARDVVGQTKIPYQDAEIDLGGKFRRLTMMEAIIQLGGLSPALAMREILETREGVLEALAESKAEGVDKHMNWGALLERLFEQVAEKKLIQPTFITEFPTETSFLSRANETNPRVVDRFELYIYGREICNGFSELNDPLDQRERFEAQAKAKAAGNPEACDVDNDFLRALEYGMPPTAGEGIGIDRLVMLLANQASIRDVILFPHMRHESN